MKTSHLFFFLILFLILRSRAATQPAPAVAVTGGTDATLRRDMDERFALLQDQIDELKNSPYA